MTIDATPGGANANSYLTLAEAQTYWASRLFTDIWDNSDDQSVALVWASRMLGVMTRPYKYLVPDQNGVAAYYRTRPTWTGTIATSTQALLWPRIGMYDGRGIAVPETVVPIELKEAVAEFAGQMSKSDRTADIDNFAQGVTSVRAGSVALTLKQREEGLLMTKVLPDVVLFMLVPSWLTDEIVTPARAALFDVVGLACPNRRRTEGW